MRLIDADELVKCRVYNDPVRIAAECEKTAYDLDKVVEQLFDLQNKCIDMDNMSKAEAYANAIELVKAGEVNE